MNRNHLFLWISLLLSPSVPVNAELVERHQLAETRSVLVEAGPGPVVASEDAGLFLVHGQRITLEGVNLDEDDPIPGSEGHAVAWSDGWRIVRPLGDTLEILSLDAEGDVGTVLELPRRGEFLDAASNEGRLAILERFEGELWITVLGDEAVMNRIALATLDGGELAPFGDGFLVVSLLRGGQTNWIIHAWRLAADGTPEELEEIATGQYAPSLELSSNGSQAIVIIRSFMEISVRVVDGSLQATEPVVIKEPSGTDLSRFFPLATPDGFLVSYARRTSGVTEERAMMIDLQGDLIDDVPADPIVAADRLGDQHLVLRPWGDAGLTGPDPRLVEVALPLKRRHVQSPLDLWTAVSGEVTLVAWSYNEYFPNPQLSETVFVRFDESGEPIDGMPVVFDAVEVVPAPYGFAFLRIVDDGIEMRRLARRGDWIDRDPIRLATDTHILDAAADASDDDLLVAWLDDESVVWRRFALDGIPLQSVASTHPRSVHDHGEIGVTRRDSRRLILTYDTDVCRILCPISASFASLVVDGSGQLLGPMQDLAVEGQALPYGGTVEAVGLGDGTWIIPIEGSRDGVVVRLASDGSLLSVTSHPLLANIVSFRSSEAGWTALASFPDRRVELAGADDVVSVTGLGPTTFVSSPNFGDGAWVALFDDVAGPQRAPVPWNGRLESADGDVSLSLFALGRRGNEHRYRLEITNEGPVEARGVVIVPSDHGVYFGPLRHQKFMIDRLAPGETIDVPVSAGPSHLRLSLIGVSSSIEDHDPSDNHVAFRDAPLVRRRTVRH